MGGGGGGGGGLCGAGQRRRCLVLCLPQRSTEGSAATTV